MQLLDWGYMQTRPHYSNFYTVISQIQTNVYAQTKSTHTQSTNKKVYLHTQSDKLTTSASLGSWGSALNHPHAEWAQVESLDWQVENEKWRSTWQRQRWGCQPCHRGNASESNDTTWKSTGGETPCQSWGANSLRTCNMTWNISEKIPPASLWKSYMQTIINTHHIQTQQGRGHLHHHLGY